MPTPEKNAHPADNGTTLHGLNERSVILCRTCMRPITWETRTEPGYLPRTGFYDDARSDPLICFRALDYRHEPLTNREWAYYEAGQKSVEPDAAMRFRVEVACDGYANLVDADVPSEVVAIEDYIAGARDAAEAIRTCVIPSTSSTNAQPTNGEKP